MLRACNGHNIEPEAEQDKGRDGKNSPVIAVNLDARVAAVSVAVVFVDTHVLFSSHAAAWAVAVVFGDADVLACIAVVSTGSLRSSVSAFPSSVLDSDPLVSLDLSGLGCRLLVLVC